MRTLFFALTAMSIFLSCAGDKKEQPGKDSPSPKDTSVNKKDLSEKEGSSLVGRWKPVDMNLKGIQEEEKKEMTANIILEFTQDGKYIGRNKDSKQEGTYSWDPVTKKLAVTNNAISKDTELFTVGWEDDLLLMTNDEGTVKLKRQ